jgi:NAD+-dependent protein deacetylase SIR2
MEPEELFSLESFDFDPQQFYKFAHDLLPPQGRYTPTHQFIRLLQDKDVLLRNYTQNIDNVESYAGIASDKVLHCHGSWATATCRLCKTSVPGDSIFPSIQNRTIAYCKACSAAGGSKRKRPDSNSKPRKKRANDEFDDDDDEDDMPQIGVMKVRAVCKYTQTNLYSLT